MKKLLASLLICFGMISFVQAQLKGTTYTIEEETTQEEFDNICKNNPNITKITIPNTKTNGYIKNISAVKDLKNIEKFLIGQFTQCEATPLDISPLKDLKKLKVLRFDRLKIANFEIIKNISNLESLYIYQCEINSIAFLSNVTNINKLSLTDNSLNNNIDLTPISTLTNLRSLNLSRNKTITDKQLEVLQKLRMLKSIELIAVEKISTLNFLKNCSQLEEIETRACKNLTDVSVIQYLPNLKKVSFEKTSISSIEGIKASVHSLQRLNLIDCPVSNLSELNNFTALAILSITGTNISNINTLASCPSLIRIDTGIKVNDYTPLSKCTKLKAIYFPKNSAESIKDKARKIFPNNVTID